MRLGTDAAAYAVAQSMIEAGDRVVEVWRDQTLVWRFEASGQSCDMVCLGMTATSPSGFEKWMPACRLHPLNIALADARAVEVAA
jgi:hypothetical protein